MSIPLLIKGYLGGATVNNYRMVKFSAADTVIQATAETDAIIGVSGDLDMTSGSMGDVIMSGIAEVESYDTITRGDLVTSDSVGRAVKVTDVMIASTTIYYLGIALDSAVASDIFQVLVVPGKLSKLDGVTASAEELNLCDTSVAGTAVASKMACLGANKELDEFHTWSEHLLSLDVGNGGRANESKAFKLLRESLFLPWLVEVGEQLARSNGRQPKSDTSSSMEQQLKAR